MRPAETFASVAELASRALWLSAMPQWYQPAWMQTRAALLSFGEGFDIWVDWYERRIDGERAGFALPRSQDEPIQLRLAAQPETWWDRPAVAVNSEIARWIASVEPETQNTSDQNAESGSAQSEILRPEIQNEDAIVFKPDNDGVLDVDGHQGIDELLKTPEARDRHSEALETARSLLKTCYGNNAASLLILPLQRYIEAIGETVEQCRPGLIIQRGDRVVGLADAYADAARIADEDSLLPPLPPAILLELATMPKAHNAMVAFDPALARRELMLGGPRSLHNLVPPREIRAIAESSVKAAMITKEAEQILLEVADGAPRIPDPLNRISVRSSETAKNLPRAVIEILWKHKGKIGLGIVGGWNAAQWLLEHEQWLLKTFADHPSMLAIIKQLEVMLKVMPFK
jgi:hypothetical protein